MQNTHKKIIMLALLLSGCALTSLWSSFGGAGSEEQSFVPQLTSSRQEQKKAKTIRVYVSGAVLEPGLYDIPVDSRAEAAITAAGGLTAAADSTRVNLARKLKDGNQVNVPMLKGSNTKSKTTASASGEKGVKGRRTSKQESAAGAGQKQASTRGEKVRLNSASASELQALPGIGPALAQRIVAERSKGRFTSTEDLQRVPGIGKAKLARLRELVEVD